jgi:hypothetical protein
MHVHNGQNMYGNAQVMNFKTISASGFLKAENQ